MSEQTSTRVATKAAHLLRVADDLDDLVDTLTDAAKAIKALRRLIKSVAGSALTQAKDRRR